LNGLLDTHTLIWWVIGDTVSLSQTAQDFIADPANVIFVSAASAWEISTKHRLGKLPNAGPLTTHFSQNVLAQGFVPLPITSQHASLGGSFPVPHGDPFDRILAAQSVIENMPIVSIDPKIDQFPCKRIW
jgi:PIN domain nuclease of toxin-antitoxin system